MNEEFRITVLKQYRRRQRIFIDEESRIHDKSCNVRKLPFAKRKFNSCNCDKEEIFQSLYFEKRRENK